MQILGRPVNKKLQDDVFCLTEERNYFQSKYLEQISEITAMKEELSKAKREIQKLREEVMTASVTSRSMNETKEEDASTLVTNEEYMERQAVNISISSSDLLAPRSEEPEEEKKEDDEDAQSIAQAKEADSSESSDDEEEEEEEEEEDEKDILRKNAEKLLQWADYRTSQRSSMCSVASPSNSARSSGVPRMIQSTSLKADVEEEMSMA